jgi:filamentous hemagglutinin family protein
MGSSGSLNHIYRTVWNQALGAMVAVAEIATGRTKSAGTPGPATVDVRAGWSGHLLKNALLSLSIAVAWGATPMQAFANPTGGVAIQGQATFTSNGNNLRVTTQNGAGLNHSAINWQSFSIPTGSGTYFQQPNASSTSINRVVTNTPSLIFGTLGSNGNLVLVNQSGITVGAGAVVDTAGFTASALRMGDADALAGRLRFGDATSTTGAVSVMGSVLARSGDVFLLGSSVDTGSSALVQAPNGSTVLAAGQQIEITGRGLEGIVMQVQAPSDSVLNLGTLKGDAVGIFAGTLKHSGLIQATTATLEGGKVVLKAVQRVEDLGAIVASGTSGGTVEIVTDHDSAAGASGAVIQSGSIDVHGTDRAGGSVQIQSDSLLSTASIDASGAVGGGVIGVQASRQAMTTSSAHYAVDGGAGNGGSILVSAKTSNYTSGTYGATGAMGGNITLAGDEIKLASTQLDASGVHGGGSIRVGGLEHGGTGFGAQGVALTNAINVYSNSLMRMQADAIQDGNGGSLVLWADQNMRASGSLSAKGGAATGNGGHAEVSGAASLGFSALADLSAPHGTAGTLLLDPHNITVVAGTGGWTGLGGTTYLEILDPTPGAAEGFGGRLNLLLPSGNIVVASPNDSALGPSSSGAVYLFSPTGSLVSALVGATASDQVGSGGISQFSNGNFLVSSPNWANGLSAVGAGAVTWMNGITGKLSTGAVGGAVDGTAAVGNSVVGSSTGDFGSSSVVLLASGHALISTPNWTVPAIPANGTTIPTAIPAVAQAGAVTWINADDGTLSNAATGGPIAASNSLVGSAMNDRVGSGGVVIGLTLGNAAIYSPDWAGGAGAVTWINGMTGQLSTGDLGGVVTGGVAGPTPTPGNSLVGTLATDNVGTMNLRTSPDGGTTLYGMASYGPSVWSGNLYVISSNWSNVSPTTGQLLANAGAFTWMNGLTGALADGTTGGAVSSLNSLVGSGAGDRVGLIWTYPSYSSSPGWINEASGFVDLGNGNFLVRSGQWGTSNATLPFAGIGAVTWVDGAAGVTGTVSNSNSIVGTNAGDQVGMGVPSAAAVVPGVVVLPNNNYVVQSPNWGGGKGAVTWGDGANATVGYVSGIVTAGNASSLVGFGTSDQVGSQGIQLQSGGSNYVVKSPLLGFNSLTNNGAVTWMDGTTGLLSNLTAGGLVDGTNSLIGSFSGDGVGGEVIALQNGHFLARTPSWNGGKGALTWMNGTTGELSTSTANSPVYGGAIDGASISGNSLVGSAQYDMSGIPNQGGPNQSVTQLGNGNLFVSTPQWTNPGLSGFYWDALGAVTWMNGTTGKLSDVSTGGPIGSANSLVGASSGDQVGSGYSGVGIVPLAGNVGGNQVYNAVIQSQWWNNGGVTWAGAATWMNGSTGTLVGDASGGVISNANSLVGTHANDLVGDQILTLANGHYVVASSLWGNGTQLQMGAVTWGNGLSGTVGDIGSGNSLVGAFANDNVGHSVGPNNGVDLIGNNYLVRSGWNSGAGSLTWVDGSNGHLVDYTTGPGIGGVVSASNSLVGLTATDNVGASNLTRLWNGNVVLHNPYSDGGKGAVTWMNPVDGTLFGSVPFKGSVSASNSLVGTVSDAASVGGIGDRVGSGGVTEMTDYGAFSNYVVSSPEWVNGTAEAAGAVTFANGATGRVGAVSTSNSLVGTLAGDAVGSWGVYPVTDYTTYWNYFVHSPDWGGNKGAITWMNGQTGALNTGSFSGEVGVANSLVGSTTSDRLGTISVYNTGPAAITSFQNGNGNLLVRSEFWNASASALTWMNGANGRLSDGSTGGAISVSNSLLGSVPLDNLAGGEIGLWVLQGNGNWVITSQDWGGRKGAVTWVNSSNGHLADGTTGGYVSALNSLVGTLSNDRVGGDYYCDCTLGVGGITSLSDGNYVVNSPDVSALTWGNGTAGVVGTISAANSAPVRNNMVYEYGESGKVLAGSASSNAGNGGVYLVGATGGSGLPTFSTSPSGDATVSADWLAAALRTGTNLDLQANTDITINSAIDASGGLGAAGTLTLRAGRSVILNAPIATGGADLVVSTDDPAATRVNRDAGAGVFVNNVGSTAFDTGAGRWLIYASSPANITKGGLVPTMYQYGSVFGNAANPVGSGFVYVSGLSVNANFSGPLFNSYGTAPTAVLGYSLNGLDAGDTGYTVSQFAGTPTFSYWPLSAGTAVGTYPLQYAGGLSLVYGSQLGVGSTQSYEVTPALLTVTPLVGLANKAYDSTFNATLNPLFFSISGFAAGEGASITKTSGVYASKNAGSGILVSATFGPSDFVLFQGTNLANYILPTGASGNVGVITPLAVNLSAPVVTKTYDGTAAYSPTAAELAALSSALLGGDTVSAATLQFSDKNVGLANKSISIAGFTISDGNGGNNYTITPTGNSISTINPALVTLTAPSISKTYDGSTAYTASAADLAALSAFLASGDSIASAALSYADKNAGVGNKVATLNAVAISDGNGGANYTVSYQNNATSTINQAGLTLSPTSVTKTYNGSTDMAGASGQGLLVLSGTLFAGDSLSGGNFLYTDKNAGIGNKQVTLSGVTASDGINSNNYSLSYQNNSTSTINKSTLSLAAPSITKTYDGTLSYTASAADLLALSTSLAPGDSVSGATLSFVDKNAGLGNKAVTLAAVAISDGNGGNNYTITPTGNTSSTINKAVVTLTAPSISKIYDGSTAYTTTTADLAALSAVLATGDSVAAATLAYANPNAGSGNKAVALSAFTINDGNGGANYTLTPAGNNTSTIQPLTVLWTGNAGTGLWSSTGNWSSPFVPDGVNVITPQTLTVSNAIYDLTAPTALQSINVSGSFTLQSGALTINGDLITPNYIQTGGSLSVSGALTVQSSFVQTAGDITKTGPISITQAVGDLVVGNMTGSTIALQAPTGAITQQAATGLTGFLSLKTRGGANLANAGNALSGFAVSDVGLNLPSSGNVFLVNNGALDLKGITLAGGNLTIETHSPITVSSPVSVSGNVSLSALTPSTSSNITINSAITSTAGGISIAAYNNFIQNSNLSAALGIDVSAGGSMTFGPGAYSIGNPVTYTLGGAVYLPPWIASTLSGGATDFVVAFLDQFQAVLDAQQVASIDDPLGLKQRGQEGIVVEGEICKP